MTRTDINPDLKYQNSTENPFIYCSPEELAGKFGHDKFHLIISTSGGIGYTLGSRLKAIANIISVLKPGGEAHIATVQTHFFTGGKPLYRENLLKILKRFKNVQITEEIFKPRDKRESEIVRLTIKKLKS